MLGIAFQQTFDALTLGSVFVYGHWLPISDNCVRLRGTLSAFCRIGISRLHFDRHWSLKCRVFELDAFG